ncbi:MAG: VTT domain-containing protein [Candidatus Dactylopiibacterium sp.]|nr:VTT domain-containing protein [Candidatus Dactylopiibacterium sp.]
MLACAVLFAAAFGAATLLPLQSELLLAGLLRGGAGPVWLLVAVASLGNVLGSCVNAWLGRYGMARFGERRWFPLKGPALARAQRGYARYGRWTLLLSWMPVVGDPLTLVAGMMREPAWSFLLLVTLAKTGRYVAVAMFALG